jgi:hypothetical protein
VLGVLIVVAAVAGWGSVAEPLRRSLGWCLIVGFGVPLCAATPGVDRLYAAVARTVFGAPLREPHRLVGLGLVPLIALALVGIVGGIGAVGSLRSMPLPVRSAVVGIAVTVFVAALSLVSLGQLHRHLTPLDLPTSWEQARSATAGSGGTVLVVPWSEYLDLPFADGRRVLNPMPDLLGGDVLASADPGLGERSAEESVEPRAATGRDLAASVVEGRPDLDGLRALGVSFVVDLRSSDRRAQPVGLSPVIVAAELAMWRVPDPRVAVTERVGPVLRWTGGGVLAEPGLRGWFGIGGAVQRADNGTLNAPARGRTALFVPSLATFAAAILWLVVLVRSGQDLRRRSFGVVVPGRDLL